MEERYIELKNRIKEHCRWIATFDREYALEAFARYESYMPWLELRRK